MRSAALSAEVVRTLAAVAGFLLLARALPMADLGRLVALTATVSLATPVLTAGLPTGLTRHLARGTLVVAPGDVVRSLTAWALLAGVPPLLLVCVLLGGDVRAAAPLLAAEVAVVVTAASTQAVSVAEGRARRVVAEAASLSLPRLLAPLLLLPGAAPTLDRYAWTYAALAATGTGLVLLSRHRGTRSGLVGLRALLATRYQAGATTLSAVCSKVVDDLDKPVLQAVSGAAAAALYAVPYRLVGFTLVPVRALLATEVPRWHRGGTDEDLRRSLARTLCRSAAVVLLAGAAAWAAWPVLLAVVGDRYEDGRALVPLLTLACVARAMHYCCGEMLVALGRSGRRALVQVAAAGVNVVLLLLLVPGWGATGAAVATAATEVALAVALGLCVSVC